MDPQSLKERMNKNLLTYIKMKILDCKVDGESFSLEVDNNDSSPQIENVANVMETRRSRTTRESRTTMYKCKHEEETGI